MIDDDFIIKEFFTSKNRLKYNKLSVLEKGTQLYDYIIKRYNDSTCLEETVKRIRLKIEKHPLCPTCGRPLPYVGGKENIFRLHCNSKCAALDKEVQKKKANTNIEKYGVDNPAKSKDIKKKIESTNLEKYGHKSSFQSPEVRKKYKENLLKKYNVDNPMKLEATKKKSKESCLKKYGVEYVTQSKEFKEISKKSCIQKYGVEYVTQADFVKNKIKETVYEKYGVEYIGKSKEIREKILLSTKKHFRVDYPLQSKEVYQKFLQTNHERYGGKMWSSSIEGKRKLSKTLSSIQVQEKINAAKRKNHTFNTSKPEENFYLYLKNLYPDVMRQYKTDLYPFNCDFYIPTLDLYIELNLSWTHGPHPYDQNNSKDKELLEKWNFKASKSKYYKKAIETWTKRDAKKREIAKSNHLNYIEIFHEKGKSLEDLLHENLEKL